jgi:glucose/arabinose dehydrogenase
MTAAVWGRRIMQGCYKPAAGVVLVLALGLCGCIPNARLLSIEEQKPIDRSLVEFPSGFEFRRFVTDLTAPSAIAFDADGSLIIAMGERGGEVRIIGFRTDGTPFAVYPQNDHPLLGLLNPGGWHMYGPVGGMVCYQGKVYVSHRDADDMGVISALDYHGHHTTVVGNLPAQGDYGVTDLAISPTNGRLYFGVGTATNSGVVGLDNWETGWVRDHPLVHDEPWQDLALLGYRFDSTNPLAGLFGPSELAVTAPYQAFDHSNQTRVRGVAGPDGSHKPNGAIYWVSPDGGYATVEAHGIHNPRGIAINEFGRVYFTNDGMEMRGTRPVKDDPDALLRLVPGAWYGWPDYTADLEPVSAPAYQPPAELLTPSGYPELRFVIDQESSHVISPNRDTLLQSAFPSLSGAARIDIVPGSGPFKEFRGNVIVAMSGDRAPFATSGRKLIETVGCKIVRVDPDMHQVKEFIRNTAGKPRSRVSGGSVSLLERPIDVKFAPDGSLYILDFGAMEMRDGREHVTPGTGQVFRLVPVTQSPTTPANRAGVEER